MRIPKIPTTQIIEKLQNHPQLRWWEMSEYLELIPDIAIEWYNAEIQRLSESARDLDELSRLSKRILFFRGERDTLQVRLNTWREYGVDYIFPPQQVKAVYIDTLSFHYPRMHKSHRLVLHSGVEYEFDEMETLSNADIVYRAGTGIVSGGQRTFILRDVTDHLDFVHHFVCVTWEGENPCDFKQEIPVVPIRA